MPLVTTTKMFADAYKGGYAIGAFNVNNMEIIQGITEAAKKLNAPLILQVSKGARAYANHTYLVKLVEAAEKETGLPIALHLDHGPDFETCKSCIDGGFTSVMIDGSSLPYEENVALTKKVVDYAHAHGVVVEGELGTLAGVEDDVAVEEGNASYTDPNQVYDFVTRTGVDSLAIAIGTSHGAYKFKPGQKPQLRFDILEEVSKKLPGFPIVLHGASSVMPEYVKMINEYGGNMPGAQGVPEDLLRKAVPEPSKSPDNDAKAQDDTSDDSSPSAQNNRNSHWPVITGYGSYADTIPQVVNGKQWMTGLENRNDLAIDIAKVCLRLNSGQGLDGMSYVTQQTIAGSKVPTIQENLVAVSAGNLKSTLIDPGYISMAEAGL